MAANLNNIPFPCPLSPISYRSEPPEDEALRKAAQAFEQALRATNPRDPDDDHKSYPKDRYIQARPIYQSRYFPRHLPPANEFQRQLAQALSNIDQAFSPPLRVLEKYTGNPIKTFSLPRYNETFTTSQITFSKGGKRLAYSLGNKVYTAHVTKESNAVKMSKVQMLVEDDHRKCTSLTFSENGKLLIVGRSSGVLEFYNPQLSGDDAFIRWLPTKDEVAINSLECRNKALFVGLDNGIVAKVDLQDMDSLEPIYYDHSKSAVTKIICSPNGRHMAAGHENGKVAIYETNELRLVQKHRMDGLVRALAFHPGNRGYLAIGSMAKENNICILPISENNNTPIDQITTHEQITALAWDESRTNRLFALHLTQTYSVIPVQVGVLREREIEHIQLRKGANPISAQVVQGDMLAVASLINDANSRDGTLDFYPLPTSAPKKQKYSSLLNPFTLR